VSTVDVRGFRRRYLPLGRVLLVLIVVLQVPAWLYIRYRETPPPVHQTGTNRQYALTQTDTGWYSEPPGEPFPISHTANLVRGFVSPSIAHVYVEGSNLRFVFPKGPDVCVSVPAVVYGTAAVPTIVRC
jgi:hypothetical protein